MLKIHKFVTSSPEQMEMIIEGLRNPKNSWDRIDSFTTHIEDVETLETADFEFFLGENDMTLMSSLAKGGPVHAKYRRMMDVIVHVTAPLLWWKEFDTYKVGTVCNSCSTMHKIHDKEFTIDDFSQEHLMALDDDAQCYVWGGEIKYSPKDILQMTIKMLNYCRSLYLKTKAKAYWWQMIQLLPTSYNQRRTVKLNYEVLHNIYHSRKNHKLDEWKTFCAWIEELPYSELITLEFEEDQEANG
jgi:hypothetical protein